MSQLTGYTHSAQCVYVALAASLPFEFGVVPTVFVDISPVEVGKPGFDTPGWDEHSHSFGPAADVHAALDASSVQSIEPPSSSRGIAIQQHDQSLLYRSSSMFEQLKGKPLTDELLSRASPPRCLLDAKLPCCPTHLPQKSAGECLVLRILAEKDKLDLPAHLSQPRAMSSESLSPLSLSLCWRERVTTTPEVSRRRRRPRSAPRKSINSG